jgi:sugar lactone lactonase YvrE
METVEVINIGDKNRGAVPRRKAQLFFYGDDGNPFLAPRGVHSVGGKLIVADTAQNRVFIWDKIPTESHQKPDLVLGQLLTTDTQRNAGGIADASSLQYPSGIWSDGNKLIVADAWNHRVLIWNEFPTENGQPANVVVGQPDMNHNLPNLKGVGAPASAQNLYWPYGVWSDGTHLWIADTGNRRVLFYEAIPAKNYQPADKVIGKNSFDEKDYDTEHAVWPYSVKVSADGALAITDTQYYRVLTWNKWQDAFAKKADAIIGQPDLDSCGQNQYRTKPEANTLNWCYDVLLKDGSIWVVDTGNSRVLYFKHIPAVNNKDADDLFGNIDFNAIGEHLDVGKTNNERLYWPFAVSADGDKLIVADTGNHRIVFYTI